MQFATITVALAGDTNNTAVKSGMSVAESAVLMICHGPHSVAIVPGTIEEARGDSPQSEHGRLSRIYGEKPTEDAFGKSTFNLRLPTRFSEIGLAEPDDDDGPADEKVELSAAEKKRRKAADKAIAALTESAKKPIDGTDEPDPDTDSDREEV